MNNISLTEQLAQLAEEIEMEDPIDWGLLAIDEKTAYRMMAGNILEMYLGMDAENRDMMLLATAVKLTVENFVLNLKLMEKNKSSE
jgi:hypothetical protein